jgi:putative hydrolase of the HAD superfamily
MIKAVIFDLGGTLVEWPNDDPARRWTLAYQYLASSHRRELGLGSSAFVAAMLAAEREHWLRVNTEQWSGSPIQLVLDGFRRLGVNSTDAEVMAVLDSYSRVTEGVSVLCRDAIETLSLLHRRNHRLGLLSNTWWAADWHDAELAAHGLVPFFDAVVYTSDLRHSKPHPSVFHEVASRLGVESRECVMGGDRPIDDVAGGLGAGMRAIWKQTRMVYPSREDLTPTAVIHELAEIPALLDTWSADKGDQL